MLEENKQPIEVVNITSPAINSKLGKYFVGKTGLLNFGGGYYAWGGIVNPIDSGVKLYIDIFTITNYSFQNFISEIWLNSNPHPSRKFLFVTLFVLRKKTGTRKSRLWLVGRKSIVKTKRRDLSFALFWLNCAQWSIEITDGSFTKRKHKISLFA